MLQCAWGVDISTSLTSCGKWSQPKLNLIAMDKMNSIVIAGPLSFGLESECKSEGGPSATNKNTYADSNKVMSTSRIEGGLSYSEAN